MLADRRSLPDEIAEARRMLVLIECELKRRAVEILVLLTMGERAEDVARRFGLTLSGIWRARERAREELTEKHGRERPATKPGGRKGIR